MFDKQKIPKNISANKTLNNDWYSSSSEYTIFYLTLKNKVIKIFARILFYKASNTFSEQSCFMTKYVAIKALYLTQSLNYFKALCF